MMRYVLLLGLLVVSCWPAAAQKKKVFVLRIQEEIAPPINRYVKLAFEEIDRRKPDYIVLEMDTYGGTLTDADEIRQRFLDAKAPVFVWINKNAASAGALIALACDSIYMAEGSSMGAATVVSGAGGEKMPDKYQSYMRSKMRATAEANGRDPKIAEAMVDDRSQIPGVIDSGYTLTFSPAEAIRHDYCEGMAASIQEVLAKNRIEQYELFEYQLSSTDEVVALFLNPFVSSLLILVILGGIYFELQTPGVGFPLVAAIVAATLYFVPYYLNGLAENWEIILFFAGLLLLAVEIFVLPGFGVAGVAGILCTVSALFLVMLDNDFFDFSLVPDRSFMAAVTSSLVGFTGAAGLIIWGMVRLPQSRVFKKIALQQTLDSGKGWTVGTDVWAVMGEEGTAHTVLRPGGKVKIGEEIYDAYSRGEYIEAGEAVTVIGQEGPTLRVRRK